MLEEGKRALNDYLTKNYGGTWKKIVRDGVEKGLNFAIEALTVAKETVVQRCRENKELLEQLTKFAVKTTAREIIAKTALKTGLRVVAKVSTKSAAKTAAKVGTKSAIKVAANPVGIVSDLAQGGLEYAGYKKAGKAVGKYGNIASGAMIGGVAAGPPGAAVGALAGFGVWVAGEATGAVVDWMFG